MRTDPLAGLAPHVWVLSAYTRPEQQRVVAVFHRLSKATAYADELWPGHGQWQGSKDEGYWCEPNDDAETTNATIEYAQLDPEPSWLGTLADEVAR